MVTKLDPKDIPFIVLHRWARYHSGEWSIQKARAVLARRYRTIYYEEEVIHAMKRAAYSWFDSLPEDTIEDMLAEYNSCHMVVVPKEKEPVREAFVLSYRGAFAHGVH